MATKMKNYIALLRGINVGGKHIVPMKELTNLMQGKGYGKIKTYIQSGNVMFQSATKPTDEIGKLIEGKFGFLPDVFILSESDLKKAMTNNPYQVSEGKTVHFFFCRTVPKEVNFELLNSLKAKSEEFVLIDKIFYLFAPEGIGRSKMVEKIGKGLGGVSMTARNLNTINKLAQMISEI